MKDKPSYSLADNAEAKPTIASNAQKYRPPVKLLAGKPSRDSTDAAKRLLSAGRIRRGDAVPLKSYPDAAALAHLVAQARFTALSNDDAIDAALELLHDCQSALEKDAQQWDESQKANKKIDEMPKLPTFPATLEDFYGLIVKTKKKTDAQPRFRRFLAAQIEDEEARRRESLDDTRKQLTRTRERIADAAKRGETLIRESVPGSKTPQEAAEFMEKCIAQSESLLLDAEKRDKELESRFAYYSTEGFDHGTWLILSELYRDWWLPEKTANNRKAGLARAKKAAQAKKSGKKATPAS